MANYLTNAEYKNRFGVPETARITNEVPGAAVVDEAKLTAAIDDAEEIASAYLATRYNIPLSAAPEAIKTIVADLARERLHRSRPSPSVTDAANRARAMLKDYSAGRAVLLIVDVLQKPAEGLPESSAGADLAVFTNDRMDRFSTFGRG